MNRDVIDLDPAFSEEFFNVSVGQSVAQIPPDSQHDDLGREPITGEGCAIDGCSLLPSMIHLFSLAR